MADTEYTKGFKAGLAWQLEAVVKKLEDERPCGSPYSPTWEHYPESCHCLIIELIKGANDGPK